MAPIVTLSVPASSSKPKSKNRRSKSSAKKNLIATQPQESGNASGDRDLIPLGDVVMGDNTVDGDGGMEVDDESAPSFPALPASAQRATEKAETRKIPIPPHRMTPLKKDWVNIFSPLTEMLGLQVRMNVQKRAVEIRTSKHTKDVGAIQKGADFVKAYALGFDVNDAIALLRLDDLYLDSFEIKDVKTLHGDHLSRAIGRIAGHDGKTKFTIENASRTRIVLADTKIHILGSFQNIKIARDALVSLILGSPPGKVYAGLRTVGARMRQRAI
ncbi:Pre-rRNA-processing protein PNO1 [Cryptococcus neoformans var, neoformans B-3501A] [Rhizoctonia solani]|uniref:Pre-rRNA-processing protein PNO1 n=1 Tax=Rhizoctonia solani TaxID=456999 RepID=A0A0K6G9U0_9AGAM|nr:Pre-rRNA-processing protein PNO1 [Cryptococcus neoformans var, neoformans B-3501A] [Rhizoctonia solani]